MNVLIVGLGSIAKKHIKAIMKIDSHANIYALRSQKNAVVFDSVVNIFKLDDVLKFDFAIISNPTSKHIETIKSLLTLKIPLFIEKPLCNKLGIDAILDAVEQQQIITYVGCNLRFLSSLNFIKRYIEQKKESLNEVNSYCGSYLPGWRKGVDYKNNYSALPELGGGVNLDLVHEIDYLFWIFGTPLKQNKYFSNKSSLKIASYDYANYLFEYKSFQVSVILNYYRRDAKRSFELLYEDETITLDILQNTVISSTKGLLYRGDDNIEISYFKQMSYFISCVNEKRQSFNTIKDAYEVLKMTIN